MRGLLASLAHAGWAMEHLERARRRLNITRGLESIGETRFGTIYWSAASVHRCLPALREIVGDKTLGIEIGVRTSYLPCLVLIIDATKDVAPLFEPGSLETTNFEMGLQRLMSVIGGFAKSIACLESSHTTIADVYIHWIGNLSLLDQLFKKQHGLRPETVREICEIVNFRFDEIINNHHGDLYVAAFFLHPGNTPTSMLNHRAHQP
jgi:hypothetical protein